MRAIIFAAALAACAATPALNDEATIEALVRAEADRHVAAWAARDAHMIFPDARDEAAIVAPGGQTIDVAAARADLQRRMDMTASVEEMSLEIGPITVTGDSAVAISNQRFVRTINQPNGPRQRISTVTHTQTFARTANSWAAAGPIVESNQTARWADEPAP